MATDNEEQAAAARELGQIGYYNHNPYPISFSSSIAGRGNVEVGAGEPVLRRNGQLVAWDPDLEAQVTLLLLTRIVPNNPNYKKYKALGETKVRQKAVYSAPAGQVPVPGSPAAAAASSGRGDAIASSGLPEGATVKPDGSIAFAGRIFDSKSALDTFLDS